MLKRSPRQKAEKDKNSPRQEIILKQQYYFAGEISQILC